MRGFYIRADIATIARLDATVAYLAEALQELGHPGDRDERRVCAVLFLANPVHAVRLLRAYHARQAHSQPGPHRGNSRAADTDGPDGPEGHAGGVEPVPDRFDPGEAARFDLSEERLLPLVHLFVHVLGITEATDSTEPAESSGPVARVEGHRPVSAAWVSERLGPRCSFRITPVLDPLAQTPVDAYEIPLRHRNAVRILTPADTYPYAAHTGHADAALQIDHTTPYDPRPGAPPGQSRIGNYGPMTTLHHRLKTHGTWQVRQPFPGIYVWQDGHGATYLVDHTGTRRLPQSDTTQAA